MIQIKNCLHNDTPILMVNEPKKKGFTLIKHPIRYYVKDFNPAEFIGEELCLMRGIRSCHYDLASIGGLFYKGRMPYSEVAKRGTSIKIASLDFKRKDCTYKTSYQLIPNSKKDYFEEILDCANGEENREQLRHELYEMMALDTFMGQTDRYATYNNYQFEETPDHMLHLAPLYDFEHSLKKLNSGEISFGDFTPFGYVDEAREIVDEHPEFGTLLETYLDVDLTSTIKSAYAKRRMSVSDQDLVSYQEFEEAQKEKIKRIVR